MSQNDDWLGCAGAIVVLGVAAMWLSGKYEIRKRPEAPAPVITPIPATVTDRPIGRKLLTAYESGTTVVLDADSVGGPRTARSAWIILDHQRDKNYSYRETKELHLIDCGTGADRTLSKAFYGPDGKSTNYQDSFDVAPEKAAPVYYPPGTIGAALPREICAENYDQPK